MAGKSVSNFDVMKEMATRNMDIQLAPIGANFLGGKASKHGARLTIGFPGNPLLKITTGGFVGGLILCDKIQFRQVQSELEALARARLPRRGSREMAGIQVATPKYWLNPQDSYLERVKLAAINKGKTGCDELVGIHLLRIIAALRSHRGGCPNCGFKKGRHRASCRTRINR